MTIESLPGEIWKKDVLTGAGHVLVSSLGRVMFEQHQIVVRNPYGVLGPRTYRARICATFMDRKGYNGVSVRHANVKRNYKVHRLVCAAFHGRPPPAKGFACHINGDRLDNRPENLKWGSAVDNAADTISHGNHLVGSQKDNTKLDETKVALIKLQLRAGERQRIIGEQFGVSRDVIGQIAAGRSWRHVEV